MCKLDSTTNAVTTAMVGMVTNAANAGVDAIAEIIPVGGPLLVAGAVVYFGFKIWRRLRGATG